MDNTFLTFASNILGETNTGLSGPKIVELLNAYAINYNVKIPINSPDFGRFGSIVSNKRTALLKNLSVFNDVQQFQIIKDLCNLPLFKENASAKDLRSKLFSRYGHLATERISETELVKKTKHWLEDYPRALEQYNNALTKYEGGIFQRNVLDDIRLAFELLVKDLLANGKSLENQNDELGRKLKDFGAVSELRNMFIKVIEYYTKYQNNYVKHDDKVNEKDMEYIIELTSVIMKYLIKIIGSKGDRIERTTEF